jgi:N-acetylmuramoyl-L-alanine amidase
MIRPRIKLVLILALLPGLWAPDDLHAKSKHSRKKRTGTLSKSVPARFFSTVVIDAGHGGFDRGGIRQNLIPEKNVALDVALNLRENLRQAGLKTVMTRSDDRFVTLGRSSGTEVPVSAGPREAGSLSPLWRSVTLSADLKTVVV